MNTTQDDFIQIAKMSLWGVHRDLGMFVNVPKSLRLENM